jgi:hypothetical protein
MPLPESSAALAPIPDADLARPAWLRAPGVPACAVAAWDLAQGIAHGSSVHASQIAEVIPDAITAWGDVRIEVESTFIAAGLKLRFGSDEHGTQGKIFFRLPWQAPRPCPKCGKVPC